MKQTMYYESGNAARHFVTEEEHEERLRREREERRIRTRARVRKNVHLMRMRKRRIRLSLAIGSVIVAMFAAFVGLQNGITESMKNISADEETLSELKAENAALISRIDTDASLSSVKKKAEKLGMKYARADQIEYYTVKEQDYMSVNNSNR